MGWDRQPISPKRDKKSPFEASSSAKFYLPNEREYATSKISSGLSYLWLTIISISSLSNKYFSLLAFFFYNWLIFSKSAFMILKPILEFSIGWRQPNGEFHLKSHGLRPWSWHNFFMFVLVIYELFWIERWVICWYQSDFCLINDWWHNQWRHWPWKVP